MCRYASEKTSSAPGPGDIPKASPASPSSSGPLATSGIVGCVQIAMLNPQVGFEGSVPAVCLRDRTGWLNW